MAVQMTNLYLLEDVDDPTRSTFLADPDRQALRAVAAWIRTFVIQPHKDLGRAGPVCPFVPEALERRTLWLAPERITNRTVPDLVRLMNDYKRQLLETEPVQGEGVQDKAIVVVLTDLSGDRAPDYVDDVRVQGLKKPAYADDGVVLGEFHERNEGTSIYNASFHPFRSPVPFLLLRHAVPSDWMFFLDSDDWLRTWAGRFGDSAAPTLAAELRRTNWRRLGDERTA